MTDPLPMDERRLANLLEQARLSGASVALRAEGEMRMLGHLHLHALQAGGTIQLAGAKLRDSLPPAGTPVALTLILGEEVLTLRTSLLEPLAQPGEPLRPAILQAAWPAGAPEIHPRRDVRVATPDLAPLEATILFDGQRHQAKLLNLTELGLGLGLPEPVSCAYHDLMEVTTLLPGTGEFQVRGEVRHSEVLSGDDLPMRIGLVLVDLEPETRETLSRFVQARRLDRSFNIRGH